MLAPRLLVNFWVQNAAGVCQLEVTKRQLVRIISGVEFVRQQMTINKISLASPTTDHKGHRQSQNK
ncbi:TPA: hypothetical protein DIC39_01620 [Patescibacteria group bacterium]|nr:hypothetical protein [Patescibacteria group bacterium]HCU47740.1 hypothetical protein [Patescibacteria group bacterium]